MKKDTVTIQSYKAGKKVAVEINSEPDAPETAYQLQKVYAEMFT